MYGNYRSNSDGSGAIFTVVIFMLAGFLACALVWSLSQNYKLQQQHAQERQAAQAKIDELIAQLEQLKQLAGGQQQALDQANRDLETERRAAAILRQQVINLTQEIQALRAQIESDSSAKPVPVEGAVVKEGLPILDTGCIQTAGPADLTYIYYAAAALAAIAVVVLVLSLAAKKNTVMVRVTRDELRTIVQNRKNAGRRTH